MVTLTPTNTQGPMQLPKTPLDLAAETAKAVFPFLSWTECRLIVRTINRHGATTAAERLILRRFRACMEQYRLRGECR